MRDRGTSEPDQAGRPGRGLSSRAAAEWALVLVFLAAIGLPLVEMTCHLFPGIDALDALERRKRDAAPTFSLRTWADDLPALREYVRYNFGFRGLLVRWDAMLGLRVLHASPSSRLIFGRGGWIFYRSEEVPDGVTIEDWKGLAPYGAAELGAMRARLAAQARWCRDRGIVCLYVVIPNKESVYPEYLPRSIRRIRPVTRLDQLVDAVRADTAIHLIDLRSTLLEAKRGDPRPLYNRGGTHWNQLGAFYAYRRIAGEFAAVCPALWPRGLDDFEVRVLPRSSFDHTLGLPENTEFRFRPRPGRAPLAARGAPVILVAHDSFWDALEPFLRAHASRLVDAGPTLRRERIERERPDIVIQLVVERYLHVLGES
ncbi:MAG TPA: hypothetical protein VMS88_03400 [Terriglobales bacterium]|nr:hypothetical protein [Terriglobales bacterium]